MKAQHVEDDVTFGVQLFANVKKHLVVDFDCLLSQVESLGDRGQWFARE